VIAIAKRFLLPFAVAALCAGAVSFGVAQAPDEASAVARAAAPVGIEIASRPINFFDTRDTRQLRFGALEFRGGLELTSNFKKFGGISGLRVMPDGEHFIAASDRGQWLRGRIVYRGDKPVGIVDAEMAPMLGPDGRALTDRKWYDTESVADDGAGHVYVGIERVNRIVRFNVGRFGLTAHAALVPTPSGVSTLPKNEGLECLAVIPKGMPNAGALIAISERGLDAAGNLRSFLIGGHSPGNFSVVRSDDFNATDCVVAPDSGVYLLERRFSWARGVAMRIRRFPLSAFAPGAVLDGQILMSADMGFQIDNMEALGVHRDKRGNIVLTLMSDDNFSVLQRTLLLQFTVATE
jgi:hypothetical protein